MLAVERPPVSLVVPVYNDPLGLRWTVQSMAAQTYPAESYEIVVVDNASDDRTPEVAADFASSYPDLVRVETETGIQSSYAARNTGIRESEGEIVVFVDADVTAAPNWLDRAVDTMQERDAAYMGCHVEVYCVDRTLAGRYDELTGLPVQRYIEENRFAPTCCLFVAREVFEDVGLFDEQLISGGDAEFGKRVAQSGRELHYAENVRAYHPARSSLRSLVRKHVRVGRGMAQRNRDDGDDDREPRPLYHPWCYLPPHPRRFSEQFGPNWDTLSLPEKLGMYGIGYLQRLSRYLGRVRERLRADEAAPTACSSS